MRGHPYRAPPAATAPVEFCEFEAGIPASVHSVPAQPPLQAPSAARVFFRWFVVGLWMFISTALMLGWW